MDASNALYQTLTLSTLITHASHEVQVGSDSDPSTSPAWPVLTALGKSPTWQGPVGTAAGIKLALNHLIAVEMVGL